MVVARTIEAVKVAQELVVVGAKEDYRKEPRSSKELASEILGCPKAVSLSHHRSTRKIQRICHWTG